ncbi:MAG TPA: NTP transferase domain-containing protein [Alphaproteobacteria bacterium]|nr:NTP transferase domain-containing protein [Alphaproteobacteria bacterium]
MAKGKIRIAIAGVGNCASALIQGIHYYTPERCAGGVTGLMHTEIGGYRPCDIEVVAAFDVDARKVGTDVHRAIFALPNCTTIFQKEIPDSGVTVQMGPVLDGISEHMADYADDRTFIRSEARELTKDEVVRALKQSGAEVLLNYVPVGSEQAARFYAECALEAEIAFVNNMPVFIASDPAFAERFRQRNIPIIGDDIKSQLGATITHRILTDLFAKRGVKLLRTYQLNTGGNTDFLNMKNQHRLASKKTSKTEAVQSVAKKRIEDTNIHIGPSDYVPWQNDNKICFLRIEGHLFGDVPMELELRLSVEDSPNSAGVVIDMIRCCKLALMNGVGGILEGPSAYFCKHPPKQFTDDEAYEKTETFIRRHTAASRRMQCVIVAAGQGTRLREKGESKPLIHIKGIPLIERVIDRARRAGVDHFFVVSGYRGEKLRRELDVFSAREGIPITHIVNEDWDRANGTSVLKAKPYVDGPFLLTMCDHLVDPEIVRDLIARPSEPNTVTLGVDYNIDSQLNDLDDVTRVKCTDGKIERIGKVIRDFNAIDTGMFLCGPIMFDALEVSQAKGDDSISGAMNVLAGWGKARAFDIQGRLWVDVDDPVAFKKAEQLLEDGRL